MPQEMGQNSPKAKDLVFLACHAWKQNWVKDLCCVIAKKWINTQICAPQLSSSLLLILHM